MEEAKRRGRRVLTDALALARSRELAQRVQYLQAGQRVRATFARHELANVLNWAFTDVIIGMPDDELSDVLFVLKERVGTVEPALEAAMAEFQHAPLTGLRVELAEAFTKIRAIARDVVDKKMTDEAQVTLGISLPSDDSDREGRPRWTMRGRLADVLVWVALRLFTEVPRSLIRACAFRGCARVFVGVKNQRFCDAHQAEANRQTQRRAEHAHRARQRAKKEGQR